MFLEITTMWKRKPCTENSMAPPKTSIFTPWKTVSPCSQEAGITDRSHQWRPRRIAVLFSKKQKPNGRQAWTFLVLVEPSEDELLFSYRQVERDDASRNTSNAQCSTGRCYYNVEEKPLRDLISCLARELAKGTELHGFVKKLAKDIFWGWEEFLNKVMQIPAVRFPNRSALISDEKWLTMEENARCYRSLLGSFQLQTHPKRSAISYKSCRVLKRGSRIKSLSNPRFQRT